MRDLYQRLGLDPGAGEAEVTRAIERCEHTALKADARTVLEVDSRREEYDALHVTLSDIGRLRARLGLTHAPYWRDGPADDFSLPPDTHGSRHDELMQRLTRAALLHNRWHRLRGPWFAAGLLALGIMLGVALCRWLG
ncbi:hypothetical protein [Halomonas kalidii]|uniref:J domain-containing protein n=1 Tax=Halomonas kalidii TaxID=3043293 RepID=A0ABT6VIB6_9GAMM|nr:hypothetical protein [Halomonas kalidii]MDI5933719.1 hypothetical protein [Halomonas kalidii]